MKNYDVCIIGGGIIGLNIAFQLARRSTLRILVLEKGAAVGEGSTGASSAVCRFRYSMDEMVTLARDGINAYRNWQDYTRLDAPRARFNNDGVLWMPGSKRDWAALEQQRMQAMGIATEVLDDAEMQKRFPAFNTCTLAPDLESGSTHACTGGSQNLLEVDGGWVDPVAAAQDLVECCRRAGVEVRFRAKVTAIGMNKDALESLTLEDGETIFTPLLINASGPWCRQLFAAAGLELDWNLDPVRIQVLYRDRPAELAGDIPVTVDMAAGIYFRTQNRGQQLIISSVLEEDERETVADPDDYQLVHDEVFELKKMHALHHRFPALPYRGKIQGYCGLYTVNLDDVHPLLGASGIEGFWLANGFSGHGFKLAPAIGSMLARAITGESLDYDTTVPHSFFAVDRTPIELESKSVLA